MITTDFLPSVDVDRYFAGTLTQGPALSQSIGKLILRSAAHARAAHPRLGGRPRKPSAEMDLGNILDELVLGGSKRIQEVSGFEDFKKADARAIRDAAIAAGRLPLVSSKLAALRDVAQSAVSELESAGVKLDGCAQACLLWGERASNGNEVQCCALLDMLWPAEGRIIDLKTGADNRPELVDGKVHRMGYHMQAAAYASGVRRVFPALAGRESFANVWLEVGHPHVPYVSEMDGQTMEIGAMLWQRAVDRWEECMRTNQFPGYMKPGERHRVSTPAWALKDLLEEDGDAA
jgi:hypothetical protein